MSLRSFFRRRKAPSVKPLNPSAMMQRAMQSPQYNANLLKVTQETLKLNEEELPHVQKLIADLEACKSVWELPILMHNVVLLGRNKRRELLPGISTLLNSIGKEVKAADKAELTENYKFLIETLKDVDENDTHPHIVYYDLSTFLTAFYTYVLNEAKRPLTKDETGTLNGLHTTMLSIMRRTETEKEETIAKCKQIIADLEKESGLEQAQ